MYLIDANIFLELELGQERSTACEQFLQQVYRGEVDSYITDFHIDAIVLVMESYGVAWEDLMQFLTGLSSYNGLYRVSLGIADKAAACRMMQQSSIDFDDALVLQAMETEGITALVSYDTDFDTIDSIQRVEPSQLTG